MEENKINDYTLKTILEISRTIISTLDFEKVNTLILKEVMRFLEKDYGSIFIFDEKSGHLVLAEARGFTDNEIENLNILRAWEEINQNLLRSSESLILQDSNTNPELRKEDIPFASFISMRLEVENRTVGILNLGSKDVSYCFGPSQRRILELIANYASIALVNAKLYRETEDLFISLVSSLVAAIDAKDPYTAGHSQRVTKIALSIAEEMNLSHISIRDLKLAAILHDIGKLGISDVILGKPSELSVEERKIIEQHPEIGVKIVSSIPHLERFIQGISDHHEFYNGKGYPRGVRGEEISLQGRIIAVADTLDALISDRAYRKGLKLSEAVKEIKQNAGIQFDIKVVDSFLNVYEERPETFVFSLQV